MVCCRPSTDFPAVFRLGSRQKRFAKRKHPNLSCDWIPSFPERSSSRYPNEPDENGEVGGNAINKRVEYLDVRCIDDNGSNHDH